MTDKSPDAQAVIRHWRTLSPLLDAALALAPDQRDGWLAAQDLDPGLRGLLAGLIAGADAPGLLDRGVDPLAKVLVEPAAIGDTADWTGRQLGAWRVVRLIGEGGSASVFLGEREDAGFAQQAAIKVLRHGMLDPLEQQRFARERRILAGLEHPCIARLIDGGVTPAGVPWFAMEFVDGEPLTASCDQRRLPVDQRLALFLEVCEAVAHAHRALVVHRDIKPGNILVDRHGRVRLLDFGIARLLDEGEDDGQGTATVTVAGQRRLTPAYAAPEQLLGRPVTTAADVYALGVLLHELLAGVRPAGPGDATTRPASHRLAAATGAAEIAAQRSSALAPLRRRLAGDLDRIIAMALREEPERRYASVEALADDVRNHLARRPVRARPDGLAYRSRRFLRRNRVAVVAAVLLLASIVAGVAATLRQAAQARTAAAHAQEQAQRAGAVKEFLVGLFAGAAPDQARGQQITALALLDRGAARIGEEMVAVPALRAEMQLVLAGIYRELGQYRQAGELLAQAGESAGVDAVDAGLELGRLALAEGRYDQAAEAVDAVLARLPPDGGRVSDRIDGLLLMAEIEVARDHRDQALGHAREAIALHGSLQEGDVLQEARAQAVLGQIAFGQGELEAAAVAMARALALRQRRLGEMHTLVATSEHDLGVIALQRGQAEEAAALLEAALATRGRLLGERHVDTASSLLNLGIAERRRGNREVAERLHTRAAEVLAGLFPEGHPEQVAALNALAVMAQERGDLESAVARMDEAARIAGSVLGAGHPTVATLLNNQASMLRQRGDLVAAEQVQRRALALVLDSVGESHHLHAVALTGLAFIELEQGRARAAADGFRRAADITVAALGAEHPDHAAVLAGRSDAERALGDLDAALEHARRSVAIAAAALPEGHPRRRRSYWSLVESLAAAGDCPAARAAADELESPLGAGEQARLEALARRCPP
ncbi:MAG: tetratricopeptide repeat protein [Xanthomonadales bacterium]|nr:tetratricopeptide repeat protein [Xanthomonadales bacterium]